MIMTNALCLPDIQQNRKSLLISDCRKSIGD